MLAIVEAFESRSEETRQLISRSTRTIRTSQLRTKRNFFETSISRLVCLFYDLSIDVLSASKSICIGARVKKYEENAHNTNSTEMMRVMKHHEWAIDVFMNENEAIQLHA